MFVVCSETCVFDCTVDGKHRRLCYLYRLAYDVHSEAAARCTRRNQSRVDAHHIS